MYRYLAIVWDQRSTDRARLAGKLRSAVLSKPTEWSVAFEAPGIFVAHTGVRRGSGRAYLLKDKRGVVLGTLFNRNSSSTASPNVELDDGSTRSIVGSCSQYLVDHYWGSYVAFVHDSDRQVCHVLREPTGTVPCYRMAYHDIHVFFCWAEDCIGRLPLSFLPNRRYVSRWLIFSGLGSRDCGIEGVEDVLGGECLTIRDRSVERKQLWNPVAIASRPRLEQADEAASELRSTIQNAVNAWASNYSRIVLRLSGGLDSSIVAACLAQAPSQPQLTFLNFAIREEANLNRLRTGNQHGGATQRLQAVVSHADERYFARLVAKRWEVPLIERERMPSLDLRRMWHGPLKASPSAYFAVIDTEDVEIELAKTERADAFFSGHGGDSILLATTRPLAAVDYARLHGIRRGLWRHILADSRVSKKSLWTVLPLAAKHGLLRRPQPFPVRFLAQPNLLTRDATAMLGEEDFHSEWARGASNLPPGKQNHLSGLTCEPYFNSAFHRLKVADQVDVLNCQPVWETALQIPAYTMLCGANRGLARRAFYDLLPAEIRKRHTKGSGTPFYQNLVRVNWTLLRDTLVDGLLVRDGYVDRQKLERYFAPDEPVFMEQTPDILTYMCAEVWLRQCNDVRTAAGPCTDPSRQAVA